MTKRQVDRLFGLILAYIAVSAIVESWLHDIAYESYPTPVWWWWTETVWQASLFAIIVSLPIIYLKATGKINDGK